MKVRGCLAATALVCLICVPAHATEVTCPSSIPVKESLDAQLQGWQTYDTSRSSPRHFYRVGFSDGPPDKLVFLTHTKTRTTKRSKVETYDFPSGSGDIWLSCFYHDSALALTKALPSKPTRCEVTYDPATGYKSVERIDCF